MGSPEGVFFLALGAAGAVTAVCILCYCAMHANVKFKITASVTKLAWLNVEIEPRDDEGQAPPPPKQD